MHYDFIFLCILWLKERLGAQQLNLFSKNHRLPVSWLSSFKIVNRKAFGRSITSVFYTLGGKKICAVGWIWRTCRILQNISNRCLVFDWGRPLGGVLEESPSIFLVSSCSPRSLQGCLDWVHWQLHRGGEKNTQEWNYIAPQSIADIHYSASSLCSSSNMYTIGGGLRWEKCPSFLLIFIGSVVVNE